MAGLLARVAGTLAAVLILVLGAIGFHAWIATTKALVWGWVINSRRVTWPVVASLTISLIVTLTWLPHVTGLVASAALTPLLAWPFVNLVAWLQAPKGTFERAPSWAGLISLDWQKAFLLAEQRRQRDTYAAPTLLDPEEDGLLSGGDSIRMSED